MTRPTFGRLTAALMLLLTVFLFLPDESDAQTRRRRSSRQSPSRSRAARRPVPRPVPAPQLAVSVVPEVPRVGRTLFVSIALPNGLVPVSAEATFDGESVPTYRSARGYRVTIPLGLSLKPGAHTLNLTATDSTGRARTVKRTVTLLAADPTPLEKVALPPAKFGLLDQTDRVAADQSATLEKLNLRTPLQLWRGNFQPPVQPNKSQGFGAERLYSRAGGDPAVTRGDTTRGDGRYHKGLDFAVPAGTPARAAAAGVVTDVRPYILTGNTVVVDHGQGISTLYGHLDSATVTVGDRVRVGQTVGSVGQTGLATGPHLHFGLYVLGEAVDPRPWFALPTFMKTSPVTPTRTPATTTP